MNRFILAIISCVLFSSCEVLKSETDSPKLGNTKWVLLSIKDRPVKLSDKAYLNFEEKDNRIAGKAACNSFFGEYTIVKQTIKFEGVGSTKMFCDGLMDEENEIMTAIGNTRRYEIKANMLYLYSTDQLLLIFKR
jgi:heat shock protein HslJ